MDAQDKGDDMMLYGDLTEQILRCAFDVSNELGAGFLEAVYENAMVIALSDAGLRVRTQAPIGVHFRGRPVGDFYADLLVESKVIVELKALPNLTPQSEAQVINYLKATGIQVGLLINFGVPKVQYRRFTRRDDYRPRKS